MFTHESLLSGHSVPCRMLAAGPQSGFLSNSHLLHSECQETRLRGQLCPGQPQLGPQAHSSSVLEAKGPEESSLSPGASSSVCSAKGQMDKWPFGFEDAESVMASV